MEIKEIIKKITKFLLKTNLKEENIFKFLLEPSKDSQEEKKVLYEIHLIDFLKEWKSEDIFIKEELCFLINSWKFSYSNEIQENSVKYAKQFMLNLK